MSEIAVVFHSGYGHAAVIAEAVARGVEKVDGASVKLIPVESIDDHWAYLEHDANAIIFGSPTYMGSASAQFKGFMDASSKYWGKWRDKLAAGFTVSASQSGDKLATLQQLAVFAAQHQMLWVSLGLMPGNNNSKGSVNDLNRLGSFLGAMAQANADQGGDAIIESDRKTAEVLGERVAIAAKRWNGHRV
ncbi:flavodoxin family protein [Burkholderia pseudomultivorans]|uniref:Flavoprotein WrbA n=2 Tax=Burkholderia cepacia complex TaxID=87882 RepID=A0AAN0VNQ1_9BURK|nr:flavodoxin family protein [Burkholderia pseudomultivorans]AIO34263.1 flavodoxin family protein [Burkholderia cenocepacia]AOI92199.1 NADPH-dependent FMN reductase [Burkholderia pseudomultivorans]MDS0795217.1 flavodoxin family protein [Burkholderia pseudomultivorans]